MYFLTLVQFQSDQNLGNLSRLAKLGPDGVRPTN
jgi:hypothetical protein